MAISCDSFRDSSSFSNYIIVIFTCRLVTGYYAEVRWNDGLNTRAFFFPPFFFFWGGGRGYLQSYGQKAECFRLCSVLAKPAWLSFLVLAQAPHHISVPYGPVIQRVIMTLCLNFLGVNLQFSKVTRKLYYLTSDKTCCVGEPVIICVCVFVCVCVHPCECVGETMRERKRERSRSGKQLRTDEN